MPLFDFFKPKSTNTVTLQLKLTKPQLQQLIKKASANRMNLQRYIYHVLITQKRHL